MLALAGELSPSRTVVGCVTVLWEKHPLSAKLAGLAFHPPGWYMSCNPLGAIPMQLGTSFADANGRPCGERSGLLLT